MATMDSKSVEQNVHLSPNPTDCELIAYNTTVAWDNPNNLMSLHTRTVFERVISSIIIPVLFLFGAPANVVNMIVFFKQGLGERINMCLFTLAVVDFLCLLYSLLVYADGFGRSLTDDLYGPIYVYSLNNNVIGFNGVAYVGNIMAAVISTERCICVLFPLQAQTCIPTKVLAAMIILMACVVGSLRYVCTAIYRVACFYEMRTGRISYQTTANEYYFRNKELVDNLNGIFYGFVLLIGCPLIVVITAAITAIRLRQIVKWRQQSSSGMSDKEIGVTKMLIWLSLEFILLSIPGVCTRLLPMFGTELRVTGQYSNTFFALISFRFVCMCTGFSINFLVYYLSGSRYRETLHALLGVKSSSKGHLVQNNSSNKTMSKETNGP